MCGISGYFSKDDFFSEKELDKMIRCLHHRGPDSNGRFVEKNVGLGHNRLSIIDLSVRGNQPMTSANGRYVIVYNGEVYNYNEIASQLRFASKSGLQFSSATDTEVILEAFSFYGVKFLDLLNGMFAFAIYDKLYEELYIFRDRVGIKPVYYYWDGANFAFSSELKALRSMEKPALRINYAVIPQYLHLGYVPAPYTIYENCYKLEPGSYIKVNKEGLEKQRYWDLAGRISEQVIDNEEQAEVVISDILSSSVQYQLKSDVPFGVFLSGGIDSSLITANAVNVSGTRINTFSIGFENQKFNEAVYARKIAGHLGTNHHEFVVTVNDAIQALGDYMNAYGEPFADSSGIPTLMVSRLARQHVTMVLSGEGGDELFHGYGAYKWAQRLSNPLIHSGRFLIKDLLNKTSSNRNRRAARMFGYKDPRSIRSHIFSQEQYLFSIDEMQDLLTPRIGEPILVNEMLLFTDTFFNTEFREHALKRKLLPQEKQALYDLEFYLPDNLLVKVDRASMWYSLETRVPFLDHRLIEKSVNIASQFKDKPVAKNILKELLYKYIPREFFDRPKQGFAIPLEKWLKEEMRFLIEENLDRKVIERYELVKYEQVEALKKRFFAGENYLYNRLWALSLLHQWFRRNA
jgi:asparagine synthase (glutamine-hydrolysing)